MLEEPRTFYGIPIWKLTDVIIYRRHINVGLPGTPLPYNTLDKTFLV